MAQDIRPRRSVLYMPGSNARAMEKARTLACDSIIFDLEDAVAPDQKDEARRLVGEALGAGGYGQRERIVRVNGIDTPWGSDDIAAAVAMNPDAILVPKVSSGAELERVASKTGNVTLWAMIETPRAILNLQEIAERRARGVRIDVFVMGTNDLAKETGARFVPGRLPMAAWLTLAVTAGRAYGIEIIDGVYNDFKDLEGFAVECAEGRDFGMDGKTLIHPTQIEGANAAFAPGEAEVEQARRIIDAFALPENKGKGAITVDGKMVELLHAEMAKRTVARAEAIAAMAG
ncbi:MAG: CoA ester lyase [Rhodobiaceae bacterium]|nr:CoA ester lyase [Rhodobiaceae bacterium]